jgi:hypothetical protein
MRRALALVAACAALAFLCAQPTAPRGSDARPQEFSAVRALATLRRVLGDGAPHPVGSPAHERVRERIVEELRLLGLAPEVENSVAGSPASIAVVRNVVARLPGTETGKAVLMCAHYDSVPAGAGAGDDGSGVATLLEVARACKAGPPLRRSLVFLFDDAEECGLVGAEAFAARHDLEKEIEVVVNADARGTDGPTMMFETSAGNADLVRLYGAAVPSPRATSAAYEVYKRMPNDTDLTVFKRHGLAGLNFAFIGGLRRYHTEKDDLAHLSPASVQHEGDQVLAVARALAMAEFRPKAAGDLVYTDVLGLFLLRWPESWSLPASIAILVALILLAVVEIRTRVLRASALAIGVLRALATIAAAALAAPAIVHGIELLRREPEPWAGSPWPFEIALAAGACLAALAVARIPWLARAGFAASWSGIWILLAAVGVASAAFVPGASYLFLVPCALAALARLGRREFVAVALPACALALLWTPLAMGLEQAMELRVPVALGLLLGCVVAASSFGTATRRALAVLASLLVLAAAWALAAPASTAERPAWVTLTHLEGPDEGASRLFAVTLGSPLPAELRAQAAFSATPERAFPELGSLPAGFAAPAAPAPADAARIDVLGTRLDGDARLVDVRISSPRGAPCLLLHLRGLVSRHADGGVVSLTIGGERLDDHQATRVFFGVPPDGVALTLRAPLDGRAEILLLDVAYGLPPSDAGVARARPDRCVPRGQGDQWVVARRAPL